MGHYGWDPEDAYHPSDWSNRGRLSEDEAYDRMKNGYPNQETKEESDAEPNHAE